MNRNNIWIHIGIAVVLVTMAAVVGQIDRWRAGLKVTNMRTAKPGAKSVPVPSRNNQPEVLVRFKSGVSMDEIRRIAAAHNEKIDDEIESVNGLTILDDLDNADPKTVAEEYSRMTDKVDYAEPNTEVKFDDPIPSTFSPKYVSESEKEVLDIPDDPQFEQQWALNNLGDNNGKAGADIGALNAWKKTHGSSDVVVAVLDSGVDYTHIDLQSNMWLRPDNVPAYVDDELGSFNDEHGYNGTDQYADPMDDNGHGTHCAGIIGAEGDNSEGIAGINWHVQIMPLKFLGRAGFGTTADAIKAINYAIDRKKHGVNVRVINASWGGTSKSKALEDTIRAAGDAGILFVAAAGNDGSNNDSRPHYPSNYDLPNVISVAALDRTDTLTSFSNFGVKTVHVAAPGKDILSTWLGDAYRDASGTSMAAPQVSGEAALILSKEPNLSVEKLKARILASVDKIESLNGKIMSGGRINAAKALGE
ncbi:MAG: S8 family serine peptidase [Pyrinomonadaceae bacterium]